MQSPNGNGNGRYAAVDWERLARVHLKDLRVAIIDVLSLDGGRILSPNDLTSELGDELSRVSYYVRDLEKKGFIELVREKPVRGAIEHFYALV